MCLGLTSVNFSHSIHIGNREDHEPYILASEVHLVYYVDDEPGLNISAAGDIVDLQFTRDDDIEDLADNASKNIDEVA
ncbi:hypothetical protein AHAS_Ahas02G0060300 [Arachis hypogaea]